MSPAQQPEALPQHLVGRDDFKARCSAHDFAEVLRLMQKYTGYTNSRIARLTEMTPSRISDILNGRIRVRSNEVIERIADGLRIPGGMLGLATRPWEASPSDPTTGEPMPSPRSLPMEAVSASPARSPNASVDDQFCDVTAVYSNRSEFMAKVSLSAAFARADEVRVAGLSLNLLCQQHSDDTIRQMIEDGTSFKCLFLKPYGRYIQEREREEEFPEGQLSALTALNIMTLRERVLPRLSMEARNRLDIAVYDEPIRFNLILIDQTICVSQPYLPGTRGVDSPTLIIRKRWAKGGLHETFERVFDSLWEKRENDA